MNVTTEKVAEGQVALTIEVEPAMVEKAMNQAYHRLAVKTLVPGFRKGKAPRVVIERFLGRGALLEEALQRLIPEVVGEAAKEQNVTPFAEPKYEVVQVEPVIVKATVDVPPVVELGDYKEIRAALNVAEVTDEDVDKGIDQTRQSMATWEVVDRPVQFDDRITFDIQGTKDGEDYFTRADYPYSVRLDNPIPVEGFAANLVGMTSGEEKEFDLTFPADHEDKTAAGHTIHFRAKVNEVKGKALPPMDDDFAKRAVAGVETVDELRRRIRDDLVTTGERQAKEELVGKIVDEAVGISKVEIPPSLVENQVHRILEEEERRFRSQRFSLSQYLAMVGKTPEQYHEELHPVAHAQIKRSLVLGKIGEMEQISVEPAELDAEINSMLGEAKEPSEEVRKFFASEQGRSIMEGSIRDRKILRQLVEIATEGAVAYPEIARAPLVAKAEESDEAPSVGEASESPDVEESGEAPEAEQGEQETGEQAQG
ncbi:MAG: trigger factor [Chloroflexi bacterium]|nr:trigger factor [Chloroflexota bacterium]